jgi:FXSXX-COOH protein
MDWVTDHQTGPENSEDLVDVTRMALPDLISSENSVLANSLRRILDEMDEPHTIIAGFSNYAG